MTVTADSTHTFYNYVLAMGFEFQENCFMDIVPKRITRC